MFFLWIIHSEHWKIKKSTKEEFITDELIEYVITKSKIFHDKYSEDTLNAIYRVPTSGRLLKVVYKRLSEDKIKIITAFWLD